MSGTRSDVRSDVRADARTDEGAGAFDSDALATINALETAGATVSNDQGIAINSWIVNEKGAGTWSKIWRFVVPGWGAAGPNAICLKTLETGTYSAGFTHNTGTAQGNGTSSFFDFGVSQTTLGSTVSSGSQFFLSPVCPYTEKSMALGAIDSSSSRDALFSITTPAIRSNYNNSTAGEGDLRGAAEFDGVIMFSRNGGDRSIYQRKCGMVNAKTDTAGDFGTMPARDSYAFALNNVGTASTFPHADTTVGVFGLADGMTETESKGFTLRMLQLWSDLFGLAIDEKIPTTGGTWITLPTAIQHGGKTIVGSNGYSKFNGVDNDGDFVAAEWTSDVNCERTVLDFTAKDDHNEPSFIELSDGRLMAFYSDHSANTNIHTKKTTTAGALDWGSTVNVTATGEVTYTQPIRFDGDIYLFYRTGDSTNGTWCFIISDDEGETWTAEQEIVDVSYAFAHLRADGTAIDIIYQNSPTGSNPDPDEDRDSYLFNIQTDGEVEHPDGSSLGNIDGTSLPLAYGEGLQVVDLSSGTDFRMWTAFHNTGTSGNSSVLDTHGEAAIGIGGAGTLSLRRYNGDSSNFSALSLGNTDNIDGTTQRWPGATFIPGDDDIIYMIRNTSGTFTIEKLTIAGDFLSYGSATLLTSTDMILCNPKISGGYLYYCEYRAYPSFTGYDGGIKRISI